MKQSLEETLRTMKTMPDAQPRESFRVNARIRILNILESHSVEPIGPHVFTMPYHIARWAGGLALASALVGGSMVYASQYSKPGSPLYPVKTASEQAALRLAPTKEIKTSVAITVIDRRAEEVNDLKVSGTDEDVSHALSKYRKTVQELEHTSGLDDSEMETHIRGHRDLLEPEDSRPQQEQENQRRDGEKSDPDVKGESITPTRSPEHVLNEDTWLTPAGVEVQGARTEQQSQDSEDRDHSTN